MLAFAACGDDDDDSGPPSRDEFIAQADAICADFQELDEGISADLEAARDGQEQAEVLRRAVAEAEQSIDDLDALEAPEDGSEQFESYLAAMRDQIAAFDQAADQLEAGDVAAAQRTVTSAEERGAEVRRIAQDYGFEVCGREP